MQRLVIAVSGAFRQRVAGNPLMIGLISVFLVAVVVVVTGYI